MLAWSGHEYTFTKRPIEIGETFLKQGLTVVLSGLQPNDRVIARATFFVDADRRLGTDAGESPWDRRRDPPRGQLVRPSSLGGDHRRLAVALACDFARRRLARDVVPDLADPQIALVADWMGHPAPDVAEAVAKPLTQALADVPGAKAIRASAMTGMAYVDVVFASADGLDAAHREIAARVDRMRASLPPNVRIYLGPAASTTGWVFEYALTDPARVSSLYEMRRFQEQVFKPALEAIPGVAEVASVGGDLRQVRIDVRPPELHERGLAFTDVLGALRPAFEGSAPDARRGLARLSLADLEELPIERKPAAPKGDGETVHLRDVALVREVDDMQTGLADSSGVRAVGGIVIAKRDADIGALIAEVKRTIAREARKLPHRPADPERLDSGVAADVHVSTVYDRSDLATRVRRNLLRALGEEVGVVVLVILIFLLHVRSALIPLATLPVVLLLTFGAMWLLGVPATIMSMGGIGIALGLAVDADVVALEASHRRLETLTQTPRPAIGARSCWPPRTRTSRRS